MVLNGWMDDDWNGHMGPVVDGQGSGDRLRI